MSEFSKKDLTSLFEVQEAQPLEPQEAHDNRESPALDWIAQNLDPPAQLEQEGALQAEPASGLEPALEAASLEPASAEAALDGVREFGDQLAIGSPALEANPAFSLLLRSRAGRFTPKAQEMISAIIIDEDCGVQAEDLAVQLKIGRVLVPRVSEFIAISIAQKVHPYVDEIEIDLSSKVYQSKAVEEMGIDSEASLATQEAPDQEESFDFVDAPKSETELFSTNLNDHSAFEITRVLSAVSASCMIPESAAVDAKSEKFEAATESLSKELFHKAFKLGAHGIVGLAYTIRAIPGSSMHRLVAMGTAVRARRR